MNFLWSIFFKNPDAYTSVHQLGMSINPYIGKVSVIATHFVRASPLKRTAIYQCWQKRLLTLFVLFWKA